MDTVTTDALALVAGSRWAEAYAAWTTPGTALSSLPILSALVGYELAIRLGHAEAAAGLVARHPGLPYNDPDLERLTARLTEITQRRKAAEPPRTPVSALEVDLRQAGRSAIEQHRWHDAIATWTKLLELKTVDNESYRRLAKCYEAIGDYGNAVTFAIAWKRDDRDPTVAAFIDRSQRIYERRFDGPAAHVKRFLTAQSIRAFVACATSPSTLGADAQDEMRRFNRAHGAKPQVFAIHDERELAGVTAPRPVTPNIPHDAEQKGDQQSTTR
jgi:tetratricopeptide (TPR) repeat protein